jgi:hypothetical protein
MSANNLLVNGKLNASYLPAGIVPENPVFESVAVVPPAGEVGYLSVENPTGEAFAIQKNANGSAQLLNEMNTALVPMITFATAPDPNPTALNITLGNNGIAPNLFLDGNSGVGEVYDSVYNPVLQQQQALTGIGNAPFFLTTTLKQGTIVPPKSGIYIFQTILSTTDVSKASCIDDNGLIEWFVQGPTGFGETLGGSMTVLGSTLDVPASATPVAEPIDWSFTNFCFLTAGITYTYNIQAFAGATPNGTWNIPTNVSVIYAC